MLSRAFAGALFGGLLVAVAVGIMWGIGYLGAYALYTYGTLGLVFVVGVVCGAIMGAIYFALEGTE